MGKKSNNYNNKIIRLFFITLFCLVFLTDVVSARKKKKVSKKQKPVAEEVIISEDDDLTSLGLGSENEIGMDGKGGFITREKYGPLQEKNTLADRMQWQVKFISKLAQFNNADLRKLDESNDEMNECENIKELECLFIDIWRYLKSNELFGKLIVTAVAHKDINKTRLESDEDATL